MSMEHYLPKTFANELWLFLLVKVDSSCDAFAFCLEYVCTCTWLVVPSQCSRFSFSFACALARNLFYPQI